MKKIFTIILLIVVVFSLVGCNLSTTYNKDTFYSDEILEGGLIPNLPKPNGETLYVDYPTDFYSDKIYVSSDEKAEDYFLRIMDYISSLEFKHFGAVDWTRSTGGNLFLVDDQYVFKYTNDDAEFVLDDHKNSDDSFYSVIVSNNDIVQGEWHEPYKDEYYSHDGYYDYFLYGTLIRVCLDSGTLEYDGGVFQYDYFLEVRTNERLWMNSDYIHNK